MRQRLRARWFAGAQVLVTSLSAVAALHGPAHAGPTQRQLSQKPVKTLAIAADPVTKRMTFSGACTPGDRIVIAGVGDLLFHESLQRQALRPTGSYRRFFSAIEGVLKGADITYGNLEGPAAYAVAAGGGNVKDPGRVMDGRVYGTVPGALIFNYHPSAVADLKASGFKVLSTANNHAADRGSLGIDRTIDALEATGIAYTGTRRRTDRPGQLAGSWTAITETRGFRVAWLACAYGTNGMPDRQNQVLLCYRDREIVMREIAAAAADPKIDAVILTPHWGLEGSATPLKTDRAYARAAIEAGASAVIGAHPHVLQPWERVETTDGRDGLVVYSTGNFVSNQQSAAQRSGVIALLEFVKPAAGRTRVSAVGFVPTWVEKQGGSGHRVVEQTTAGADAGAALKATLKLLPTANRVTARDFRSLPRECPAPVPQTLPAEPLIVAAAPISMVELHMPAAAPTVQATSALVEIRSETSMIAMLPLLELPRDAPPVTPLPSLDPLPVDTSSIVAMLPPLAMPIAAARIPIVEIPTTTTLLGRAARTPITTPLPRISTIVPASAGLTAFGGPPQPRDTPPWPSRRGEPIACVRNAFGFDDTEGVSEADVDANDDGLAEPSSDSGAIRRTSDTSGSNRSGLHMPGKRREPGSRRNRHRARNKSV